MSEIKIFDRIVVDEPQYVERAVFDLTGKKVNFELIRKFILNEKDTMFYMDRKMNSSTDPGCQSEYLWLDTGFRDDYNQPIMISLQYRYNGYVGHYTKPVKELYKQVKAANKKNTKDIDKNYSRFLTKYRSRSEKRETVSIENPADYAISVANRDVCEGMETGMALAMKNAGISIEDTEVVEEVVVEEIRPIEEKFTCVETEITMGLLLDQMDSMQNYIDQLLDRIEKQEKTSQEEIEILKAQNQEYRTAIYNIRLFNSENAPENEQINHETGHGLLGKNGKILVLGNTDIRVAEMRAIARNDYGFEKDDFEFITDYEKVKSAGNRIHGSTRYVAVIFGNCPHKVSGIGKYSSIIDEFKQKADCPISVDARNEAGGLKITKQSFRSALSQVCMELRDRTAA